MTTKRHEINSSATVDLGLRQVAFERPSEQEDFTNLFSIVWLIWGVGSIAVIPLAIAAIPVKREIRLII